MPVGYILRRLLRLAIQVFIVLTLMFVLFRLVPGDPVTLMIGPNASQEQIERAQKELGLDQPIFVQYFRYLTNLIQGNLGISLTINEPVLKVISERIWPTVRLMLAATFIAVAVGVPAGMYAGIRPHSLGSNATLLLWVFLLAIPNFWLGLLLIQYFSVTLGWLPAIGYTGVLSLILPAFAIAARLIALVARITRSSMMEVLSQEYMRTAKAKGLRPSLVIFKHALRPALVPIITLIGIQAGYLLGGSVVIENLFSYQGMGQLLLTAATMRDYPLMQGCTIFFVGSFLLINLVVDLSYAQIDPRIRYG